MPTQASLEQAAREAWPDERESLRLDFVRQAIAAPYTVNARILLALARRIEAQQADDATVERVTNAIIRAMGLEAITPEDWANPDKREAFMSWGRAAIDAVKEG